MVCPNCGLLWQQLFEHRQLSRILHMELVTCLATQLLPAQPYGSVIICDNTSFNKGGRVEELIQEGGCVPLHLPP